MFRPIPFSSPKTGQFAGNGNVLLYELAILDPTPPPIPPDEQFRIIEGIMEIVMADDLAMNANSPLLFNGAIPPIDQMALKGAVKNWMDSFRAIDSQLKQIFGPTICELFFIPILQLNSIRPIPANIICLLCAKFNNNLRHPLIGQFSWKELILG